MTNIRLMAKEEMECVHLPQWLQQSYKQYTSVVMNPKFPCFFGQKGERKGELRYSYITHDDWSALPGALFAFLELLKEDPTIKRGFFLFVEPENVVKSIEYYRAYFWRVLDYLHEHDHYPWPADKPKNPDHPLWDFCFGGEPIFAFGNAPAYVQRKTRDLGQSLVIGFQPRIIFQGLEGTDPKGINSREAVRKRVEEWDQLPKHPDISHFGDPDHREWKQFFIGDDVEPIKGKCPFSMKE